MSSLRTTTIRQARAAALIGLVSIVRVTHAASQVPVQYVPSEVRWSVAVPAPPAASPSVSGSHVYVSLKSGIVAAHRTTDGAEVWWRELRTDWPVEVAGDQVFVAAGEVLHALDAADGETMWTAPAAAVTAPLLAQDGWILAAARDELIALRATDGTVVWRVRTGVQSERASIEGDRVYVPLVDRILALDLATGERRWEQRVRGAPTEVLALSDRIYFGSSRTLFYCLKAASGQLDWHFEVGAQMRGKPAVDATHVYVVAVDNVLRALDRRSGTRRWYKDAGVRPTTGARVIGGAVVVSGAAAELDVFNAKTGVKAGHITLAQSLLTPPGIGVVGTDVVMAAMTGDLAEQWTLTLTGPPVLAIPELAPLTELPGVQVWTPTLTDPPGWATPPIAPLTVLPGVLVPIRPPG